MIFMDGVLAMSLLSEAQRERAVRRSKGVASSSRRMVSKGLAWWMSLAIWRRACSPVERARSGSAQSLGSARPTAERRERVWGSDIGEDEGMEEVVERGEEGWEPSPQIGRASCRERVLRLV